MVSYTPQTCFSIFIFLLFIISFAPTDAYDSLDPFGNITIKWDVKQWNGDGYAATVTIYNYQQYRHIQEPGWRLGWTWAKKEVIWNIQGAVATDQGDCTRFKGSNIPHSCMKNPTIVDLAQGAPYNQQAANCCKSGVLTSMIQDPHNSVASFEIGVGQAGTSNTTVRLPQNFILETPGPGYTCGPANILPPTKFYTSDQKRVTRARMTWALTCTYSQFLAQKAPSCCVSLSAFYSDTIVNCPACTCGCPNKLTQPGTCVNPDSPNKASSLSSSSDEKDYTPLVQCTSHMCPIRVHWHIKLNYRDYWRVKVTITNFNYNMNYSQWNLVVQHPNFDNLTQSFSFNSKPITPYSSINDTAMFWGVQFYNDMLMQAGPSGNVQSELLFRKEKGVFRFDQGWAFPRKIYFNGENCVMPPPQSYPFLPSASSRMVISVLHQLIALGSIILLFACFY